MRDIYEQDVQVRRLIDQAKKLEGVARNASTHAAGVVISETAGRARAAGPPGAWRPAGDADDAVRHGARRRSAW